MFIFPFLLFSVTVGWTFYRAIKAHEDFIDFAHLSPKMNPATESFFFPLYLLMILFLGLLFKLFFITANTFIEVGFLITVFLSLYLTILFLLRPLYKKRLSPITRLSLWTVPICSIWISMIIGKPVAGSGRLVITLPQSLIFLLGIIWGIVFLLSLGWSLVQHLQRNHTILKEATPVEDLAVMDLMKLAKNNHRSKQKIQLYHTPAIHRPQVIGIYGFTRKLVLPEISYTPEEYAVIFRYALYSACRNPVMMNYFIMTLKAIGWFNPFTPKILKAIAQDLQCGCDESMLNSLSPEQRKIYLALFLPHLQQSQWEEIENTLEIKMTRRSHHKTVYSTMLIGGMLGLLLYSSSLVAFAEPAKSAEELIFQQLPVDNQIDSITVMGLPEKYTPYRAVYDWDEEGLMDYLASLSLKKIYYGNLIQEERPQLSMRSQYTTADQQNVITQIDLFTNQIAVNLPLNGTGFIYYESVGGIDWAMIASLLDFEQVNPDPDPVPPELKLYFDMEIDVNNPLESSIHAVRDIAYMTENGELIDRKPYFDQGSEDGIGGINGYPAESVQLDFSYPPARAYTVTIINWDGTDKQEISSTELVGDLLPLQPYDAHYQVTGYFETVRNTTYQVTFYFDVVLPKAENQPS